MSDSTFDNDDNPYGNFVLHLYSNMKNQNDTEGKEIGFIDHEIPIGICDHAGD
jgi:hypothetical protein